MVFVVVYDASVLYPNTLRDLSIRIAQSGLVQAKWSEQILDEMFAAAIRVRAQSIVTANLRHFPSSLLREWDITPQSPDDFVRGQISLNRGVVRAAVQQIADSWRKPPGSFDDVLDRLERAGLAVSTAELRTGH